jgi:dienelactone hydrolase
MTASQAQVIPSEHREVPFTRMTDYGMDPADARELLALTLEGSAWPDVAAALAQGQRDRAKAAEDSGHLVTACEAHRASAAAYLVAQLPEPGSSPRKLALYREHLASVEQWARLSTRPVERVTVPYAGGELGGWLMLPSAGRAEATVLVWGGLNGWGAAFLGIGDALVARGMAALVVEGPGQGLPLLAGGLHLDGAVADGFAGFLDLVDDDPRLDGPVGVQGNSFGGLFAALLTSKDERVRALGVNGSPSSPMLPDAAPPPAVGPFATVTGTDDVVTINQVLASLRFDPATHRIAVPLLILHGDADPLVGWEQQAAFAAASDPDRTTVRRWPGGEHTLYNHPLERNAVIADWFADQLIAGRG